MCSSTSSQSVTSSGRAMLNPLCQKIVAIPFREKAGVERKGTIVIAPMRARPQPAHPASRPFLRRRQADRVHALPEKSLLPPEWHGPRSEEHTSELQSLMRISYAVFCLKKKKAKRLPITL